MVAATESAEARARVEDVVFKTGLGNERDPANVAARLARFVAESEVRGILEGPVRVELVDLERDGVAALAVEEDAKLSAAIERSGEIIQNLHRLRAGIGTVEPRLRTSARERFDSWRFGSIGYREIGPDADGPAEELHFGHRHIEAAVLEAERERRDALDAITTVAAAAQSVQTKLVNKTRVATEGFQIAATALTAALAGPGLLFALWALDVWSGPWYATLLAGVLALLLLLSVWAFLHRQSPQRKLGGAEVYAACGFVLLLVLAGFVAPSVSDPGDADQTRQTVRDVRQVLERSNRDQEEQLRLLRRQLRGLRADLRRTAGP